MIELLKKLGRGQMSEKKKKKRDVTEHTVFSNRFLILRIIKTILIFIVALLFTFFTIIVVVNLFFPTTGVSSMHNIAINFDEIMHNINI